MREQVSSAVAHLRRHPLPVAAMAVCLLAVATGVGAAHLIRRQADVIIGRPADGATTLPIVADPGDPAAPAGTAAAHVDGPGVVGGAGQRRATAEPVDRPGLFGADGRPYGGPVPFNGDIPVPGDLVWILLIGGDARPGQDIRRSNADSIHLVAANPATGQATVVGFPRDSYVKIPGHGVGKINSAMALGGPELLATTIHQLTGLPVQHWVLASFQTFSNVVNEVGGVDVLVDRRMDDPYSGAHFQPGYHHMDGAKALAYSRDRHDVADGDFTRSAHQGEVVLAALRKLRAEVSDEDGLLRWVGFAYKHLQLDVPRSDALGLMAVARATDAAQTTNLVLEGRGGSAGGASVVYLDVNAAAKLFDDLRPDAVRGTAGPARTTTTSSTSSTSTSTSSTVKGPSTSVPIGQTTTTTTAPTTSTSTGSSTTATTTK